MLDYGKLFIFVVSKEMEVLGSDVSCALDEKHVYAAICYVENNPVSARVVKKAENYNWSSAKSHIKKMRDQILAMDCYLVKEIKEWKKKTTPELPKH
jgi:putative transposase